MSAKTKAETGKRPSLMGEAPRLALLLLPLLGAALVASLSWPRAFSFLGKLRGAGLALGLELAALGLLFWLSAAFGLVRAYRSGRLALRGAYGLCRHPIFSWWIFSVLPALALCLDSWLFLALAFAFRLLSAPAAKREEAELEGRFGEEYANYRSRTRAFLPLPYFRPLRPRRYLKAAAALVLLGLFALTALFLLVAPLVTELGTTKAEREASWPDQTLLKGPGRGFFQAVEIEAPPEAVWPWLVQVGYRRGGWYNVDAINRLAARDYFLEGGASARRIVPELQGLAVGDTVSIAPGMDFRVQALERERLLVLAADPSGMAESNTVWTFALSPAGEGRSRLLSRFQAYSPRKGGALEALLDFVGLVGGPILQQPAMFAGLSARAEAAYREARRRD